MFKNLRNSLLSAWMIACCGSAVAAASIPRQFQGVWTPSAAECKTYKQDGVTDQGFNVSATGYQQYETGCDLKKVIRADRVSFIGDFTCNVEGNTSTGTDTFVLSNGALHVNDSETLRRCK
ncbi:hypothetical protein [Paraburkholderia sp. MM5482-R1]|uniref:hypothetical protein n=1 Tax=unclassified Paraburkholderia TaxID=2615204 RepID=UPI003D249C5A